MTCCNQIAVGVKDDSLIPADLKAQLGRTSVVRHCDVCFLLHGDLSPKQVTYCKLCDKFMCETCKRSPWRRAAAAIALHTRSLLKGKQHHGAR